MNSIRIKNLVGISASDILSTFNIAFADYSIPMHLSLAVFEWKLRSEHFNAELSVGAFDGDLLVGFILHCTDLAAPHDVYNGGTGVIVDYRGRSLTKEMYRYILPVIKAKGFDKIVLEVIDSNIKARKSYLGLGFEDRRFLHSYRGTPIAKPSYTHIQIREIKDDWTGLAAIEGDVVPTWQNTLHSLRRVQDSLCCLHAQIEGKSVGYCIYNPYLKRIHYICITDTYRREGVGSSFINYIMTHYAKEVNIINIDSLSTDMNDFFKDRGLINHVNSYEMQLKVS